MDGGPQRPVIGDGDRPDGSIRPEAKVLGSDGDPATVIVEPAEVAFAETPAVAVGRDAALPTLADPVAGRGLVIDPGLAVEEPSTCPIEDDGCAVHGVELHGLFLPSSRDTPGSPRRTMSQSFDVPSSTHTSPSVVTVTSWTWVERSWCPSLSTRYTPGSTSSVTRSTPGRRSVVVVDVSGSAVASAVGADSGEAEADAIGSRSLFPRFGREDTAEQEAAEQRHDDTGDDELGRAEHGLEPPLGGLGGGDGGEDRGVIDRLRTAPSHG